MQLSIIVAMSENRTIGRDNRLPWNLPDEWANFKKVTEGKPFLMGRKSFESQDGLYSSYRTLVLSSQPDLDLPENVEQARSLGEAFDLLREEEEVFILGGESLFEKLLPQTHKLYLTIVHAHIQGDTFFPEINWPDWHLVQSERHEADADHAYAFSMNQYVRNGINS
ncbi:dihydrofolate reductase [Telluribacter sp.]|jgi:dihydrofolate reductase|uniref:dihydrofolate reductase n=1 Tax=Telluribacter sp. TaxID=1978767 RepID=UPI002E132FFF|nr:dihydrofolate reductase [Telluribacter sp.]